MFNEKNKKKKNKYGTIFLFMTKIQFYKDFYAYIEVTLQ